MTTIALPSAPQPTLPFGARSSSTLSAVKLSPFCRAWATIGAARMELKHISSQKNPKGFIAVVLAGGKTMSLRASHIVLVINSTPNSQEKAA